MLLEASREAADMLNLSVTGLRSRQLLVFFDGEREHWRQALRAAAAGLMVDREGAVRPQGKAPRAGPGRDHQGAGLARLSAPCSGRSPRRNRARPLRPPDAEHSNCRSAKHKKGAVGHVRPHHTAAAIDGRWPCEAAEMALKRSHLPGRMVDERGLLVVIPASRAGQYAGERR